MDKSKSKKSETDNAWVSTSKENLENCSSCNCGKKEKSETNNEWTSTNKTAHQCDCEK